jgi:hypothetical protein
MPRPRPSSSPPLLASGGGSLSAWAQVTLPIAALRETALLSRRMWDTARRVLPAPLCSAIQPGRLHDGVWSLTAGSSAVAAKLSQFKPVLLQHLQQAGFSLRDIRIRVQPQEQRRDAAPCLPPQGAVCPAEVLARLRALREG